MHLIDALAEASVTDIGAVLAPQIRFRSPYADYRGRDDVAHLVGQVRHVLGDVDLGRRLTDARTTMTAFEARVGGEAVQGVLVEERDEQGRVADAMLTIRPYAGLRAALRAMDARLAADPLPSRAP
jgi:hypothetical protein